jgi:flagellar hook-basal body complex protein FliE
MAIAPIAAGVGAIPPIATPATQGTQKAGGGFLDGLEAVQNAQNEADALGTKVATGELKDVHEFMAASAKASLAVEMTVAVRNKAVEAYQEIMRMSV